MPDTATVPVRLRIDFVSDVVCPWCAIGLASLEQALARTQDEVNAELHFRPFELNPQLAAEGEDIAEHLAMKYGLSAEQLAQNHERIRQRGAELGVVFSPQRRRIHNTFDAHRLLHWAGVVGQQRELKHALLRAYFSEGQDVSDHDTLARIAGESGLPADRAREVLSSSAYADEVRADEQISLRNGIQVVPAVIIEQKHLISGGQPVKVFEHALRQIAAGKAGEG